MGTFIRQYGRKATQKDGKLRKNTSTHAVTQADLDGSNFTSVIDSARPKLCV